MITGLKCDPIPNLDLKALNKGDSFKDRFFPEAKKVRIEALKMFLNSPIQVSDEDMVRLANLYLLEIFFLAKSEHSLVDLKHLLIANDLQAFNDYPWGRVIFEETAQQVINCQQTFFNRSNWICYGRMCLCTACVCIWDDTGIDKEELYKEKWHPTLAKASELGLRWKSPLAKPWNKYFWC